MDGCFLFTRLAQKNRNNIHLTFTTFSLKIKRLLWYWTTQPVLASFLKVLKAQRSDWVETALLAILAHYLTETIKQSLKSARPDISIKANQFWSGWLSRKVSWYNHLVLPTRLHQSCTSKGLQSTFINLIVRIYLYRSHWIFHSHIQFASTRHIFWSLLHALWYMFQWWRIPST